ncbi:MAG: hypothetical protein MUF45_16235 [Spirosomaceae bacterium]|jgi:hypothetical protein|nr:hypothetical protein [Spirosomataceae bacterium]
MKNLLPLLFVLINAYSGMAQTKFSEKKAGHIFSISVPDYMVKTVSLNDAASAQYMNSTKNAYLIVIADSKEDLELSGQKFESPKDFHDSNIASLKTPENSPVETAGITFEVNGNKFFQSELKAALPQDDGSKLDVSYLITYVESKTHYYQILCWTLTPNFNTLLPDFKKIASSLKD